MGCTGQLSPQIPRTCCKPISGTFYPLVQLSPSLKKCVWGYPVLGLTPAMQRLYAADLRDMTSGSPGHSHLFWEVLAHAAQLTRGPVGTKCTVLAPGFTEPAAALGVRGLLAMQQVLADVVSNGLPADIQVNFIFLQGICERHKHRMPWISSRRVPVHLVPRGMTKCPSFFPVPALAAPVLVLTHLSQIPSPHPLLPLGGPSHGVGCVGQRCAAVGDQAHLLCWRNSHTGCQWHPAQEGGCRSSGRSLLCSDTHR